MRTSSIPHGNMALSLDSKGGKCLGTPCLATHGTENTLNQFHVQPPHDLSLRVPLPTAQRLARYQEADSEEEEVVPREGSLPQRGSTGSHQGIRVLHRSQSTRSHRRTGSRAEAKRASMLSRHTAFSSPMVSLSAISRHHLPGHRKCLYLQGTNKLLLGSYLCSVRGHSSGQCLFPTPLHFLQDGCLTWLFRLGTAGVPLLERKSVLP